MLRASRKTRDLACVKVSLEVQLGVNVFNLCIAMSVKAKVVKRSTRTVHDSHMSCLCTETGIVRNKIRCNIVVITLSYYKETCLTLFFVWTGCISSDFYINSD